MLKSSYQSRVFTVAFLRYWQGRSDWGVYRYIYPPNQSTLIFFMWLFCLLDPGQIRYRASDQCVP